MALGNGYNPPGSVTQADICALLDAVARYGIILGDINNAYILSKIPQGTSPPNTSSVIVYIENGRLVYGPATALGGGGGGGGAPDIRPLNNVFTGTNYFNSDVIAYANLSMPHLLAGTQISGLVAFDSVGRFVSVPYQTVAGLLSAVNAWTGSNTFAQNATSTARVVIGVPLQVNTSSVIFSQIARNDAQSLYVMTLDNFGNVYKVPLSGAGSGGGTGVITSGNYQWTGDNEFTHTVVLSGGFATPSGVSGIVNGSLYVNQVLRLGAMTENNGPKWALTWNELNNEVERTFLEAGPNSQVTPCTNITVNYTTTFNASISHTSVPTTSMGDSVIPAGTSFTPSAVGRIVRGKLVVPNVKVTAGGTAYLHIHVWANSALVRSFVEPASALAHGLSVDFQFTSIAGANTIVTQYAVEWSSGATGVVVFNETANGKYQPYLIIEELLKT